MRGKSHLIICRYGTLGFETVGSTPDEFASQIRTEIEIRGKIIREAGVRA
jgi:hypothetical protein